MAADKVSICSNALMMLGAEPIADFSEANDPGIARAQLANGLWDNVLEQVQRSHPWNCCVTRAAFSPDSTSPAFGYTYQFTLPGDCLRILEVGMSGQPEGIDYRIERGPTGARAMLCNDNPLYALYIKRNDNVSTWDASLVTVMTYAMAHAMAYAITRDPTVVQQMDGLLRLAWCDARTIDGMEEPPRTFGTSMLRASRYGDLPPGVR